MPWPGGECLSADRVFPGLAFLTLGDWAILCWVSPGHYYWVAGLRDSLAASFGLPSNPADLATLNFAPDSFPPEPDEDLQLLKELEALGCPIDWSPDDF